METAKEFASKNKELIDKTGAKVVVSDCPGCIETLKTRYKKAGIEINTRFIHIIEYIKELVRDEKLKLTKEVPGDYKKVTIHDPCLLARNLNDIDSIRFILNKIPGIEIVEPIYNKEFTHCCGWSGTVHWADREIAIKEAQNRINELKYTGSNIIISACPECELGLAYGVSESDKEKIQILDIVELLVKAIE
jgi:Fe-S oxidoreductase